MINNSTSSALEVKWDREQSRGKYHTTEQRYNIYELQELHFESEHFNKIGQQVSGIGCLIPNSFLCTEMENTCLNISSLTLSQRVENVTGQVLGEQEPFYEELSIGHATAFLIDEKRVLTAAHAICKLDSDELDIEKIESLRLVFGFQMVNSYQCNSHFEKKDVYKIKKVKSHVYKKIPLKNMREDWAVLKLDRAVEQHSALKLNFDHKCQKGERVYMLGFPLGQPMKFTWNGIITCNFDKNAYQVDLEAFQGNSGSPVFLESTGEVVGILCSGHNDFVLDDNYRSTGLTRVKMKSDITKREIGLNGWEWCQRINTLSFLQKSSK